MAPVQETVPAAPFAQWLNRRLGQIAARADTEFRGAVEALVYELGWDTPTLNAGIRKLYRFRHQLMSGSRGGVKGSRPADTFPRETVEEALYHAGVMFDDIYPEIAAEEDVELEPDAFCHGCRDQVIPIDGCCPWCDWRTGPPTGQRLLGKRRAV